MNVSATKQKPVGDPIATYKFSGSIREGDPVFEIYNQSARKFVEGLNDKIPSDQKMYLVKLLTGAGKNKVQIYANNDKVEILVL